jgi:hypothetical protein
MRKARRLSLVGLATLGDCSDEPNLSLSFACEKTQIQMAKLISSSQSRVAKLEKAESSVSIDLILRSLFALGTRTGEIADILIAMNKGNAGSRIKSRLNRLRRPSLRLRKQAPLR